jgi:hydroxyacylglutathione hydrolase
MITIKTFIFNAFAVNTFLLYDETGDCVIIDPGCMDDFENVELTEFIYNHKLQPVKFFNTHAHVDHIAGNKFVAAKFNIGLEVHKDSISYLQTAKGFAAGIGLNEAESIVPSGFLSDGDVVKFGNSTLKVLFTPGHADGSICFYSEKDMFVIVGDVLFNGSIGRTDFPTGNFDLLMHSIKTKLFVLPADTLVYPGHGSTTTIGYEKKNNPFMN